MNCYICGGVCPPLLHLRFSSASTGTFAKEAAQRLAVSIHPHISPQRIAQIREI
jgi:hypothetical protein